MSDPHFVYVVATRERDELRAPIKVGISALPESRLYAFQMASPATLVLYRKLAYPDQYLARDVERCFKDIQRAHKLRGEWFGIQPSEAVNLLLFYTYCFLQNFTLFSKEEKARLMHLVENGGP